MERHFDQQLGVLRKKLIQMAAVVEMAITSFPSSGLGTQLLEKLQLRMEKRMKPAAYDIRRYLSMLRQLDACNASLLGYLTTYKV